MALPDVAHLGDPGHIADHNLLISEIAAKAALASPAFTGTPTLNGVALGASGLNFITSGTVTAGSALSFNNCFTSTYENYRLLFKVNTSSASPVIQLRLRASSTDNTTTNYFTMATLVDGTAISAYRNTAGTCVDLGGSAAGCPAHYFIDIQAPQLAEWTGLQFTAVTVAANSSSYVGAALYEATTQFDGFTILGASGTITIPSCRVFGYQNA